ncbi:MAG: TRAP transporter small permease subunit [Sedimentibacter sp.]|uniref:TRAP transporter small permease n=1 Tax=Sedimentibacter sp. TaxID=1960295 RepID=UPI003158EECC
MDDKVDVWDKALDKLAKLVKYFLGVLLGIMLISALFAVFTRYFIGKSFAWSEELIRYLIIWVSILGAAVGYKEEGLVFFDMIVNAFKGKKKRNMLLMNNTVTLIFIIFIFINSIKTIQLPSVAKQISIGLQISMVIPFLAVPLGLGLMIIFGVNHYRVILRKYNEGMYN